MQAADPVIAAGRGFAYENSPHAGDRGAPQPAARAHHFRISLRYRRAPRGAIEMAIEIRVPTLGELITEATVGKWFKKAGDPVQGRRAAGRAGDRQGDARGQCAELGGLERDCRRDRPDGRRSARCSARSRRRGAGAAGARSSSRKGGACSRAAAKPRPPPRLRCRRRRPRPRSPPRTRSISRRSPAAASAARC